MSFFMAAGEAAGLLLLVILFGGFSCDAWLGWFTSCPVNDEVILAVTLPVGLLLATLLWFVFHRKKA